MITQQQFQMTPFYAPASDDRKHYNADGYYNNYGNSAAPAPHHPDPTTWNNGFASPPPPTWNQVQQEFGRNQSNGNSFDLLDNTNVPVGAYLASRAPSVTPYGAPEGSMTQSATFGHELSYDSDIPPEIIASQERAMEEAKNRQRHGSGGSGSSGSERRVTVQTAVVPRSSNPAGSDAVHPNRNQWKQSRGAKTAVGATSGAIIGGIAFGPAFPVGMVLGGAVGGYATNKLSKHGERRAQRDWEQSSVQHGAMSSLAGRSHASVV